MGAHREKGLRGRNADTRLGRPTQRGRQREHWRGRGGLSAAGRASGNRTGFEGRWRGRPTTWALRPAELACPFQPRGPRAHGCPESERNPEVPENTAGHPTARQGSLRPYNAAAPSGLGLRDRRGAWSPPPSAVTASSSKPAYRTLARQDGPSARGLPPPAGRLGGWAAGGHTGTGAPCLPENSALGHQTSRGKNGTLFSKFPLT